MSWFGCANIRSTFMLCASRVAILFVFLFTDVRLFFGELGTQFIV